MCEAARYGDGGSDAAIVSSAAAMNSPDCCHPGQPFAVSQAFVRR